MRALGNLKNITEKRIFNKQKRRCWFGTTYAPVTKHLLLPPGFRRGQFLSLLCTQHPRTLVRHSAVRSVHVLLNDLLGVIIHEEEFVEVAWKGFHILPLEAEDARCERPNSNVADPLHGTRIPSLAVEHKTKKGEQRDGRKDHAED